MKDETPEFIEFYSLYPRKCARGAAWLAYRQVTKAGNTHTAIIAGLRQSVWDWNLRTIDKTFIPHPATYLRARSFLDELTGQPSPSQAPKALHASWNGSASLLIKALGQSTFDAYFADQQFLPGPPPQILCTSPFKANTIANKFRFPLQRIWGEEIIVREA